MNTAIAKKDYDHLKNLWFSDVCKSSDELETEVIDKETKNESAEELREKPVRPPSK